MLESRGLALVVAVAGLALSAADAPTPVPTGQAIVWDAKKDGSPKTYAVGELRLTFASARAGQGGDAPAPTLTVVSPRFGRVVFTGQVGFAIPAAQAAVIERLDPKADGPAVVFTAYTGGAHCCTEVTVIEPIGGRWRTVDGGTWNSAGPEFPPKDIDGDGQPDFLLSDDRFLYAFACYACGAAPPKIADVIGGVWTDVSTSPRFAPVFREDLDRIAGGCGKDGGQNGVCAAYVADEARLGRFRQGWAQMLTRYDKTDDWELPTGCAVPRGPGLACPAGREVKFKTYPEALKNFLLEAGYITPAEAAAAPTQPPH